MHLSDTIFEPIDETLGRPDAEVTAFATLRARLPGVALIRCDAADVIEPPFRTYPAFDLHLIGGTGHCTQLVVDLSEATGIVLARRSGG